MRCLLKICSIVEADLIPKRQLILIENKIYMSAGFVIPPDPGHHPHHLIGKISIVFIHDQGQNVKLPDSTGSHRFIFFKRDAAAVEDEN